MKIHIITLFLILGTWSNSFPQDFWEEAGLDTTTIYSLAINSSGDIFAGTNMDGVFRSTDNGDTWINLGIMNFNITSMVISSSGDIYVAHLEHGGLRRSTDNGDDWTTLDLDHFHTSVVINSNGDIFVGTGALGVYRSTDNGMNWAQINQGLTNPSINSILINPSGHIFAGTISGGVFRSLDNGENWIQINQGLSDNYVTSFAINSSGHIFAGTANSGVFRSTNNGNNWVQINQGLIAGEGYRIRSFAKNTNGDIFTGTAFGVFRSIDNGENWIQINQGLSNIHVHSLAINSNGDLFAGTEGGIFKSMESTLPVELFSFSSKYLRDEIRLNWVTKTEVNNYGFNVERRINESEWNTLGFVEGHGNSNSPKEYSYSDKDLFAGGSNFQYRLKQVDTDGQFEYSDVVEVEVVPAQFELSQNYPNPFNPTTTIRFSLPQTSQIKINLYNVIGELVATLADGMFESGNHKIEFNASSASGGLPSGTYIYRITSDSFVQTKKMLLLK
ncbi:MAG: T9SS type A sorting domain-containing protein [Ignavibacteriaceae bacterium]|nr:T9SS type A sorting domain-containing protein [Ignavibacteriaceae bacterium]